MAILFALIGIIAIGFLLWRGFGRRADPVSNPSACRSAPRGPDDDPDFLIDLDRRTHGPNGSDSDEA